MSKIRVAIVGMGNIGNFAYQAVCNTTDMEVAGIVVRSDKGYGLPSNIPVVKDIKELGKVDVAVISTPSRSVLEVAEKILALGISCVDSFDIHSSINDVRSKLDIVAKKHNSVAITAAGWDPGSDSVIRAMFLAMSPKGITYTNFGPGVSMGHSVCARSKDGVEDAISLTFPKGEGIHRRMVYVKLKDGHSLETVTALIKQDPYFAKDETFVTAVGDINTLKDLGHGVTITRKGVSGETHNQLFSYDMRVNNPALTSQILISCARAALKQKPGAYTMIEIPPIHYLEGDRDSLIAQLV